MDFYKWCSVLCQLWLLPSWISTKTIPEAAGEKHLNSPSRPDIQDSSTVFSTIANFNVTENYETTYSASTDSSSKTTDLPKITKKLSTGAYSVLGKNSSPRDSTTKSSLEAENVTVFIDNMSENKTSFGDNTEKVPSENSGVVTVATRNVSLNTARVTERHNSDSTTIELEGFRETTTVIYTTVDLDRNKTTVNTTTPLDIDDLSKTITYTDNENNTSANNSSSISPSTTFHSKSTTAVAQSSDKRKPIPWTTPHPNVVRNMWLAKRARSRTHTGSLHHLSLVPIEDGPFGSLIWKDKKYLITVLVPIGIGIIGAVCIISMAYVVRFCHRHERKMQEIRETIQKRYSNQNDQVILLTNSSDDEF
ncbi:uncharacterized protein LOC117324304 [Pecten maximus]|uniref:uncharacterized protein LOC117324304 n=1 Tax=Pecten maximus TaxID=6579 RepID=UPI001458DC3B|nr:uncharacterized protein LOC117324304 [Pecten maximus]